MGEDAAGYQVPPRPRPALTGVATGRRPAPLRCSAISGHLQEKQGVRGLVAPRLPGPQPHNHSLDSQVPKAAMLGGGGRQGNRKWAWTRQPRGTLPGKTEADILNVVFNRWSHHLALSYGSRSQLWAASSGQEELPGACILHPPRWLRYP